MDLSVIIVNYNVKYFLEQCLCSVINAARNIRAEIIVVDNNSSDGSRSYLEKKFPEVIFKWNNINAGFAKANNSALQDARGECVLFLNPDTIVAEDCFEQCLAFVRKTADCGALGVRMIDGAGYFLKESKRSFPSVAASFYKMTGFTKLFPYSAKFSRYYAGHLPEHDIHETDVLAGAFLFVHQRALNAVKGFDEDFFMYGEDIDFSWRIQEAGFKNYYFPQTTIIHFKGESAQKDVPAYIHRFYEAMQLFVKKHYRHRRGIKLLMKPAIHVSKLMAYLLYYSKKILSRKKIMKPEERETIVVADQQYFNEMIGLIKHAADPLIIQGRIALDSHDKNPASGSLGDIAAIVKRNKIAKIIFCESPLTFSTIIELTDTLKGKADFLYHAKRSENIVGSNNKNVQGLVIASADSDGL